MVPFPTDVSSYAPLQVVLAAISSAVGGESTGKLLVVGLLFGAATLAYQAVPTGGFVARATAATIYVINPFVYGRLHYGQLFLLAGYALLPWVATRFRLLLTEPQPTTAILAAVSLTLLGILSIHLYLVSALLLGALAFTYVVLSDERIKYLKRLIPRLLLTTVGALGASAYWIFPLVAGRGPEGTTVGGIGVADLQAFAAVPDQQLGLVPNLLGLYGFWAEDAGRFTSMKAFVPVWPAILILLLLLCGIGVIAIPIKRDHHLRPWVAGLLLATVLALILEMGVSHPVSAGLVRWLDANFPLYRGMRDSGKWAALLALAYSQLGALGVVAILGWIKTAHARRFPQDWAASIATALLLALPLYYGNGLLFGAHGEIRPSQYPAGWYAVNRVLAADRHPVRAVFLPWHEYMSYSFVRNQNNVVGPPAPTFFSIPVLVSSNPEVPGLAPAPSPDQDAITSLVLAGNGAQWAHVLAEHHLKYVLLAHELNWSSFQYLDDQPDLVKIGDYGSIALYRNSLVT